MKLATLIYEIVRESNPDAKISFSNFIDGSHDNDREFSQQISLAFHYANLAISRLITDKKTKLMYATRDVSNIGLVDTSGLGEVYAVIDDVNSKDYVRYCYKDLNGSLAVESKAVKNKTVVVEYRKSVPNIDMDDRGYDTIGIRHMNDQKEYEAKDIDLERDYGITNDMANYIKLYAIGGCTKFISPSISQNEINMAESSFSRLRTIYSNFPQRKVVTCKGVNW